MNELRAHLPPDGSVLEVGSGAVGIGEYWTRPFVGCDLGFSQRPRPPLKPVICSATALPFPDQSFDALIASDVMEHIPPPQRRQVISEAFRVARRVVIIGYPCGQIAWASDRELQTHYLSRKVAPPTWLEEHMLNPFPDESVFNGIAGGWRKKVIPNESIRFHSWMMRREMDRVWGHSFRLALRAAPGLVRRALQFADGSPNYRQIFVFTRG